MKCRTCDAELYADGSCPFMCVWTNQEEHPASWPIEVPIRVTYKALITSKNWIRVVDARS